MSNSLAPVNRSQIGLDVMVKEKARTVATQVVVSWVLIASLLTTAAFFALGTRTRHADGTFDVEGSSLFGPLQGLTIVLCLILAISATWSLDKVRRDASIAVSSILVLFFACNHFDLAEVSFRDYLSLFIAVNCLLMSRSPTPKLTNLCIWVFVAVNFGGMIFKPASVFYTTYDEGSLSHHLTLLNLPVRLFGTESHPNVLGFVAGCLLLIVGMSKPRGLQWVLIFGLVVILLLTQSKTAVVALLLTVIITRLGWKAGSWVPITILGLSFGYIFFLEALGPMFPGADLSLTGRTVFWDQFRTAVTESPLFGYGIHGVSEALAGSSSGEYAAATENAHNMVWQTLIQGGLVGIAACGVFIAVAWNISRRSRVASALMLFAVIRGMSEGQTPAVYCWIWVVAFLFYEPTPVVEKVKAKGRKLFRRGGSAKLASA